MTIYELITHYNNQPKDSMYSHIARVILNNYRKISSMGIENLAMLCNVAPATISRFCREIGCAGFNEFKSDISTVRQRNLYFGNYIRVNKKMDDEELIEEYMHSLDSVIHSLHNLIKQKDLSRIVRDLRQSKLVAFFGQSLPQASIHLQVDLSIDGKDTTAYRSLQEQLEESEEILQGDMAIMYHNNTFQGEIYDEIARNIKSKGGKLVIISNSPNTSFADYADYKIVLDGSLDSIDEVAFEILTQIIGSLYRNLYLFS